MRNPKDFDHFDDFLSALAEDLGHYADVPENVLEHVVRRDGSCMWLYTFGDIPEWTGDDATDRRLAEEICRDCPVQEMCLELELRQSGPFTTGVWGALPEQDRRALYLIWRDRHDQREGGDDE
ncbi:WhiB family transcriptional regulator [Prauserella rugosa]|uniref:WhiB family redox-sensing transcriptional regulator n=1 Tax=Prauserella rugosa TaxID=43354 RepID=A0A660CEI5_9PSEU|nr:WhiB family transcriptional regulator [Prauserella rugosa]TWH20307.1 WhiB family redox-sensing transcriptional regulator [Prauserella rugosa]